MHNIEYYDYKENVNKNEVFRDLNVYVQHCTWQEGGSGIDGIRWHDQVCDSYEAAKAWIGAHDKGWYDCLAVKYKSPIREKEKTAKLLELEKKIQEAYSVYKERSSVIYPRTRTSEFIGCGKCGSKLSSKLLNGNNCPVCHADLRPETTLKSIETAKAKWERAQRERNEYVDKHSKKEIKWLVKIEYHT